MIDIKDIQQSPDFASLMGATIDDHALDMMIEDAWPVISMDKEMKLIFLLFLLGSEEEILSELKSIPYLRVV